MCVCVCVFLVCSFFLYWIINFKINKIISINEWHIDWYLNNMILNITVELCSQQYLRHNYVTFSYFYKNVECSQFFSPNINYILRLLDFWVSLNKILEYILNWVMLHILIFLSQKIIPNDASFINWLVR